MQVHTCTLTLIQITVLFNDRSIRFTNISLQLNDSSNGTAVTVEVILPSASQSQQVISLLDHFSSNITMIGIYSLGKQSPGYTIIEGSSKLGSNKKYCGTFLLRPLN